MFATRKVVHFFDSDTVPPTVQLLYSSCAAPVHLLFSCTAPVIAPAQLLYSSCSSCTSCTAPVQLLYSSSTAPVQPVCSPCTAPVPLQLQDSSCTILVQLLYSSCAALVQLPYSSCAAPAQLLYSSFSAPVQILYLLHSSCQLLYSSCVALVQPYTAPVQPLSNCLTILYIPYATLVKLQCNSFLYNSCTIPKRLLYMWKIFAKPPCSPMNIYATRVQFQHSCTEGVLCKCVQNCTGLCKSCADLYRFCTGGVVEASRRTKLISSCRRIVQEELHSSCMDGDVGCI